MDLNYKDATSEIIASFDANHPAGTAAALRDLWSRGPTKSLGTVSAADRERLKATGVAVSVLTDIGKTVGKVARKQVNDFLPLTRLLWDEYGREGRIVAVHALGPMELAAPEIVLPMVTELARTCAAWEDCDQLAMRALEPIVRQDPDRWLPAMEPLLADESKWVRRAAATAVGRLPMKHPAHTPQCLQMLERVLLDGDTDVKRAVSFAIRLCARGDVSPVRAFLARHVPPQDPASTWVLCDAIRSMAEKLLPEFVSLLPQYEQWAANPALGTQDRRSVKSALKTLRGVPG
jgi:3-methyladenine DNA glycosylase AlkD